MKRSFVVRIVLVRTIYERNVGAVSRAMSNMGFTELILIDPQCEMTYEAQQAAATGQTGLQNRKVYKNWDEFFQEEPESIRISFTARDGRGRAVRDLVEVYEDVKNHAPVFQVTSSQPVLVHLIFGPEDWGLNAEDLTHTHFCACIPTFGENWSLNLAQAALLAMYDLRKTWGGQRTSLDGQQGERVKAVGSLLPDQTIKTWLLEMGFDLSKKKINAYTVLRRMLLQNTPTKKEIIVLEAILQQSIRKLREWKEFQKNSSAQSSNSD